MKEAERCVIAEVIYNCFPLVPSQDWPAFTYNVENSAPWSRGRHHSCGIMCYRCGLEAYFEFADKLFAKLDKYAEKDRKIVQFGGISEVLPKNVSEFMKMSNIARNSIISKTIGINRLKYFLEHGKVKTRRHQA